MTDDFVEYMTSNAFLIQAEVDKIIAILLTTAVLAIAIARARHLLVRSVSEGAAARDLSRFFDPGVAAASAAPRCRSRRAKASCATWPS